MAICSPLDAGITEYCGSNPGGIKIALFADFDKVFTVTISTQSVVTAISMTASGSYYNFEFKDDVSNFDFDNTPTKSNDTVKQNATLVFQNLSTTNRNQFNLLRGKKLSAIYGTNDGKYWLSGHARGVRSSGIKYQTGTDRNDDAIWTVSMYANEDEFLYEVQASVVAGWL